MSFSSLLRNASPCHPLRREKEKKGITMLSESFAMREESPSFLLFFWKDVPAIFPKKGKESKDGSIGIRHHGGRRFMSMEERKRKKKKAKERNPPVCRAPVLGKRAKRKGGSLRSSERFFPFAEKGERLQRTGENLLSPFFLKKEKKKREAPSFPCCLLPSFSCVPSSALF